MQGLIVRGAMQNLMRKNPFRPSASVISLVTIWSKHIRYRDHWRGSCRDYSLDPLLTKSR